MKRRASGQSRNGGGLDNAELGTMVGLMKMTV